MSAFSFFNFEDDSLVMEEKTILGGSTNVPQFVNPQYTDRRYSRPQVDMTSSLSTVPHGLSTPRTPRPESRRQSQVLSDTQSFSRSVASSSSSFESSPNCLTPLSSLSSSPSRRQSVVLPESQQYYLSATSSSPSVHPQNAKLTPRTDQYPLHEPFSSDKDVVCSKSAALASENDASCLIQSDFFTAVDGYSERPQMNWQGYEADNNLLSTYEQDVRQSLQIDAPISLSLNLAANIDSSVSHKMLALAQPCIESLETSFFDSPPPMQVVVPSQTTIHPKTPIQLGEPFRSPVPKSERSDSSSIPSYEPDTFDYGHARWDSPIDDHICFDSPSRDQAGPRRALVKRPYSPPSIFDKKSGNQRIIKHRKANKQVKFIESGVLDVVVSLNEKVLSLKKHQCKECPQVLNERGKLQSTMSFERPEHLKRHVKSAHHPFYYHCTIPGCERQEIKGIQSRSDNLKPHYKTHFKYGVNEKAGKNKRISLKSSNELGLRDLDPRWPVFLEGRMDIDRPDEPDGFHYSWKMLGFSIRETQLTKVKDIIPEWDGPDDATLKQFDPRWKKMLAGTMDFEMAMSVGEDMVETAAQGLLGVDMLESESMGLKEIDPRWLKLVDGAMSIEESEKLGVKHRNPKWINLQSKRKR
ncbi:hypothetical protein MMC28_006503 [Mycoblastus sanguinarius]|nr:hypothetical protein [Mycoblastus sanguinarius]